LFLVGLESYYPGAILENYVCYEGKKHNAECRKPCHECASYGIERRKTNRRRNGISLKLWERREGFDRRQNHLNTRSLYHWIFRRGASHLRNSYYTLVLLLIVFNLLNLADYFFTVKALSAGFIEGNPIMDKLFSVGPAAAVIFKVSLAVTITAIVWVFRKYRVVLEVSILFILLYMCLIAYHIYGAIRYY